MAKKKNKFHKQAIASKITKSFDRLYDVIIVGSTVSLGLTNIASDIMSDGGDVTSKVTRLGKRLVGRVLGVDVGEGGQVLNLGGAFTNGQFLAGITAGFVAKLLGEGQRMVGMRVVPTAKIRKWGRLNTAVGFGTGLISENPPSLSEIFKNSLGATSTSSISSGSNQIALSP